MIDKIDKKLLLKLTENSRTPISTIAKQLKISRDVANYRIKQLVAKGIIRDFITEIDTKKMGFTSALLFISIKAEKETEFISDINKLNFVSWAGTHLGLWSLGLAIYGKTNEEIEEKFQTIFQKYKDQIIDHRFELYKETQFFTEKYFGQFTKERKISNKKYKLDKYDKTILKILSKNSRITSVEISKEIPLTAAAIAQRISKLEKNNYIIKYSIYINIFKMDLYLFIFFIKNRKIENRKKLYSYLKKNPKVTMLVSYIGDPFIEFSLFAKDPYEIRKTLQEIKETFPENEITDFFLTQEDFISYGAPKCIFD